MAKSTLKVALLSALLQAVSATPAPRLTRRWEQDVDCTWDTVDAPPGLFFAVDNQGTNVECDQMDGLKTSDGIRCYRTNSDQYDLGDPAACPGDPAPSKNPDGSDASIGDGIIQTWCSAAQGAPAPLDFASIVGCMVYGYYSAQGDPVAEATSGAMGICDIVFAGACTWFVNIAPGIAEGMSRPCVDDPGSYACGFANPGK